MLESSTSFSRLLSEYQKPQPCTLRCDSCPSTRQGQAKALIEGVAPALVLGVPRAGNIDSQGVQHRNRRVVEFEPILSAAGQDFALVAVVEHTSSSTDSRAGHFVTWVHDDGGWKLCNDFTVERRAACSKSV